jgi:alkylhydroperoxidase/carboxymuconolactone decarboxylase family protein YurZ
MEIAHHELFRRLALSDEHVLIQLMTGHTVDSPQLDEKTSALGRLAGLAAMGADVTSFQWVVDAALAAGAEDEDVIGALLAVAPIVGLARVAAAAQSLAPALGYQLEGDP